MFAINSKRFLEEKTRKLVSKIAASYKDKRSMLFNLLDLTFSQIKCGPASNLEFQKFGVCFSCYQSPGLQGFSTKNANAFFHSG